MIRWMVLLMILAWPCAADAMYLKWARNADSADAPTLWYQVYACWVVGCDVAQLQAVPGVTIMQPDLVDEEPWWLMPADKVAGRLAVSAVNFAGESPLSESVTFGFSPPLIPRGLHIRRD